MVGGRPSRERGPRRRSRRQVAIVLLATTATLVAAGGCGLLDDAAEEGLERLAQGTWTCEAPERPPYTYEIGDATFRITFDDPGVGVTELDGSWAIEDGDLRIEPSFAPSDRDELLLAGVADLGPGDTPVDVALGGPFGEVLVGQADGSEEPEVTVTADGTDEVTFQQGEGDVWTCTRQ